MKLNRITAFLFGLAAFAASLLAYLEYVYMLGFPDGYITELGYAERTLAYIFIAISLTAGACFVYLGWAAAKNKIGGKLSVVGVLYLLCVACLFAVDSYFRSHLDNGAGG